MKRRNVQYGRGCLDLILVANIFMVAVAGAVFAVTIRPSLGAQGSDVLRSVIGDRAVSALEMALFQTQDAFLQLRYSLKQATPVAPWQVAVLPAPVIIEPTLQRPDPDQGTQPTATPPAPIPLGTPATAVPQPRPAAWQPAPVVPLGSLPGEGAWSPYIQDFTGRVTAYRTYLQPDPTRPYAIVGVVAFDLAATRLHFVLGSVEPFAPDGPHREGAMPGIDKTPGVLLAMFNGGFKAGNGQYGAMADGLMALPPRDRLGTIAMYKDASLRLGEWGNEIQASPDMVAWRQNGPLVIHKGEINPYIYYNRPTDWGYTVTDVSPTWRSGFGLSADGKTYYYLCGSSLSMEMLAKSMQAAGLYNGLQLDINAYWVNFVAVRTDGQQISTEALFPDMMKENIDRYLHRSTRDFFYVTISGHP